ncbi:MAG: protein kinase, partial [Planctomycetes bacterium]|nr:protein kinase [Planctomycetota bacterium]
MPDDRPEPCPQHELIEAFAHDKLDDVQRREAESVLQESEPCRELFRQLTAGRYPRLPNYTIIGQVGKGGFGVVYKAIHHAKERTEALKVLFSKTPLLTEYFQDEVHLIARLRHANIATLYDAQLSTPPLYYTMEFVEGERLSEYLKRGDVSLAERIDIIKSVARAVGYAHTQGVVHRDLKPS